MNEANRLRVTADDSVVLWVENPTAIPVTAKTVGTQFVDASDEKQIAILCEMADALDRWTASESWSRQCRYIADGMPYSHRSRVAWMLEVLYEHLSKPR